ncbi:HYR domain-containing protein [Synoicihabitans lomoniglobus]|uniref:HYR domain-containing protein n=1 Tax=Synoicihabitans lomoniglobus TaxID=2909285 RepID=A0AAE9ZV15_9BACT|nr:HYR domain-containing protein [Opitutaceae bacterium LMO-M01]WED64617.1 HYR domain-containing protein [Opitutaceae bacterium LMO-M01]
MKKLVLLLSLGLWAALPIRAADTVELLPGKISGSITLSTETVKNGTIYANATDGSGQASTSFTGSEYSLVVPAGKSWKLTLYVYPEVPSGASGYIYLNLPEVIGPVGAEETVTHDLPITSARIVADVQVANGTLTSIPTLQANGNSGTNPATSFNFYGQNLDYAVVLPMNNVSIYGSVKVTSADNVLSAQSLTSQSLNVGAAGITATWNIDAAFAAGAIQGDVNFTGSATPNSNTTYLYSSSGGSAIDTNSLSGNGNYQFNNLVPGSYRVYNYAYFTNSQLYMYTNAPSVAGSITQLDFAETVSFAQVDLNPTGFLTPDKITGGYAYGNWTAPSPNPDGVSRSVYANFDTTAKNFKGVVTPGEWKFSQININGYDYSQAGIYISYAMGIYDYTRANQGVTFAGGVDQVLPSFDFDTTQTELTFDVVEAADATSETLISNARVTGSVVTYVDGSPQYQLSFSSSTSTSAAQPRQRVRIVGVPGTYNVQTYGTVDGSSVSFGNFSLELKEPLPTPVGTSVEVSAGSGVGLVFDEVTTSGVSTASQLPVGPALPAGYTGLVSNGEKAYYSVSTTATFSGYVDVTVDYSADAVPPELESELTLFYYDDPTQTWIDVTIAVDELNNQVLGTAPELSLFALGLAHAPVLGEVTVPTEVLVDTEAAFVATFADSDPGEQHTATFDWGDGTTSEGVIDPATGEITGLHTYTSGGSFNATLTLTDITGKTVEQEFTVEVIGGDDVEPVITFGAIEAFEALSADGAEVEFAVTATDETDGEVTVTTSVASGTVFPIGTTIVIATATDAAGNEATAELEIIVQDTTGPAITAPDDVTLEATNADGAIASFLASATDLVSGEVPVTASVESGSTFAVGSTTVSFTATDESGNESTGSFNVIVQDTTAPELTTPADLVLEATSADGATATFAAGATDLVSGDLAVTASAASGSTFAVGTTTVELTAADAAGNTVTGTFTVTVEDTTAPEIVSLTPSTGTLWPANHKMVDVSVAAETSDAVGVVSTRIVSVTSSESDNGHGDGHTRADIVITGDLTVSLRAERSGRGDGRVYTITVESTDAAGNVTTGTTTVAVPKSQGRQWNKSDKSDKGNSGKGKSGKGKFGHNNSRDHDDKSGKTGNSKSSRKKSKGGRG